MNIPVTTTKKSKPRKYAIASCTREATATGIEIADGGGNAVDAAVGVAFNLMVSNPLMCSFGGGGYATIITPDKKVEVIDFFDCMPGKGLDQKLVKQYAKPTEVTLPYGTGITILLGHPTIGVPGTAKGLELLLQRHGTMPLKEVLQPSIRDAKKGIHVNSTIAYWLSLSAEKIHWHTKYAKKILSTPAGEILTSKDVLKQPDLAETLKIVGKYGSDVIYKGDIAEAIVQEMETGGGLITMEDLKTYQAIIREPLISKYKNKTIYTNPPPSVGGATLIEILNIMSYIDMTQGMTPSTVSQVAKAIRKGLSDKVTRYLDPDTNEIVSKELLSDEYAIKSYKAIQPSSNTTQLSCIDDSGYGVSITMSMGYGSGVAIPDTGIIMDNVLGEMELNPKGYLQYTPGTRLISGMAPTIVTDNNQIMVIGTPGASRIAPSMAQFINYISNLDMNIHTAIAAPRVHYEENKFTIESLLDFDESLIDPEAEISKFEGRNMFFGGLQIALLDNGEIVDATADPRRSGSAQTLIV